MLGNVLYFGSVRIYSAVMWPSSGHSERSFILTPWTNEWTQPCIVSLVTSMPAQLLLRRIFRNLFFTAHRVKKYKINNIRIIKTRIIYKMFVVNMENSLYSLFNIICKASLGVNVYHPIVQHLLSIICKSFHCIEWLIFTIYSKYPPVFIRYLYSNDGVNNRS